MRIITAKQVEDVLAKTPEVNGKSVAKFHLTTREILYQNFTSTHGRAHRGPATILIERTFPDGSITVRICDPEPGSVAEESEISVREAGRRGGETVKLKYGHDHYSRIGKMGGATLVAQRGAGYLQEIGKKGGDTVKANHPGDFYTEIGKKGGAATRRRGSAYYSEIGKKGGAAARRAS